MSQLNCDRSEGDEAVRGNPTVYRRDTIRQMRAKKKTIVTPCRRLRGCPMVWSWRERMGCSLVCISGVVMLHQRPDEGGFGSLEDNRGCQSAAWEEDTKHRAIGFLKLRTLCRIMLILQYMFSPFPYAIPVHRTIRGLSFQKCLISRARLVSLG